MGRSTSNHELLMKLVESGEIQLSAIAKMDYDDLEELYANFELEIIRG